MEEAPTKDELLKSMQACCKNADRLLDEAQTLEFEKPLASRFFLSMIAQEECAKAFLLHLVAAKAIPWNEQIFRATRDHKCKQLIGILLDYLNPSDELFDKRMDEWRDKGIIWDLSSKEKDAMNILRHEKIGRWESKNWIWESDPEWDEEAMDVAEGARDRDKQDSLYVGLSRKGEIISTPEKIEEKAANEEYERGRRFKSFISSLISGNALTNADYKKIRDRFEYLFLGKI